MPLKICAVTSTRADWGILTPVLRLIADSPLFRLQIIATGQHLVKGAGDTIRDIDADGFTVTRTIDMNLTDDSPRGIAVSLGNALSGFGHAYADLQPDLLLVLGDRYEIVAAVLAASLARIPVAHIGGGDITEGAADDAYRHAITKMSHLHFVTTQDAGHRVRQLGEADGKVFVVGSPSLDRLHTIQLLSRTDFFAAVGLVPRPRNILVTFHPETLAFDTAADCQEMLIALDRLGPEVGLIVSGTNSDVQGLAIGRLISDFTSSHSNAVLHPSLGSVRYFSALKHVDAVVGNSSSGLYEAPSFGVPTVNIGDRQKGRIRAASVIDIPPRSDEIHTAIARAFATERMSVENPYGDGHSAERIIAQLALVDDPRSLLVKRFVDWTN